MSYDVNACPEDEAVREYGEDIANCTVTGKAAPKPGNFVLILTAANAAAESSRQQCAPDWTEERDNALDNWG